MKFEYPDINTTTHNNQRWYHCDDHTYYPSITTILGKTMSEAKKKSLENWRQSLGPIKADAYTKARGDSGTNVHLMIEQHLDGQPICCPRANAEDRGIFNSLKFELKKIDEIYGQEVALYSDVLGVAGRCDCVGIYKGIECIIDFKTTARNKSDNDIKDYWLQCTFYALAHNEMFGTDIMKGAILMGNANGIPLVWQKDLHECVPELVERIDSFYEKVAQ